MQLQVNWHKSAVHVWERSGAPAEHIRAALGELCADGLVPAAGEATELAIRLPGAGPERAILPALRFSPADAIDLLASMPSLPAERGDSLAYWRELALAVVRWLASQQFYPGLRATPGELAARWRVWASSARQVDALHDFAQVMPPVCLATADGEAEADPARLVESFLDETADAFVRREVAGDEFFQRIHEKAREPDSGIELRWLSALIGPDARVNGEPAELETLAGRIGRWTMRLIGGQAPPPAQLVLRLVEPEGDVRDEGAASGSSPQRSLPARRERGEGAPSEAVANSAWRLDYALELTDSGQTIPAGELLARPADEAQGLLGRTMLERRGQLLAELSRAASIFPPLERLGLPAAEEEEISDAESETSDSQSPVSGLGLRVPGPGVRTSDTRTPTPGTPDSSPETPIAPSLLLTTAEASLLIRHAKRLTDAGIKVVLPDWAAGREASVGLVLSLRPVAPEESPIEPLPPTAPGLPKSAGFASGQLGLQAILDFDWQAAVGDFQMTPAELESIAGEPSGLVRIRGQWVMVDESAMQRMRSFLRRQAGGRMTLAEALRSAFAASVSDGGLPIVGLRGTSWLEALLDQTPTRSIPSLRQPRAFKGKLRPYQLRGMEWLAFLEQIGLGACLADDMGLGKTIQLIALLLHERSGRKSPGPTLLFAPTSVVTNWVREVRRFAPSLKVLVQHGPERLRGQEMLRAARESDLVITSYALAHRDLEDLVRPRWHRLALDEAQKIKNPYAAATLAIRSIQATHHTAMTGTPLENHLSELWSIMEALNPGLLGSAGDFRQRFAVPVEKLGDRPRATHLRNLIRPFVLRRLKNDPAVALDLPPKMEYRVFCNLTPEQAVLYQRVTDGLLGQVDSAAGIRRRGLILAALTRLKQVCNHPALVARDTALLDGRSGKCERLVEMLEEVVEEGDTALVFTQFKQMGDLLERLLAERLRTPVLFLHGGTPAKQRQELIDRFQAPGSEARVFLLSLRAGGLGLNLTAANHVFHFDRWWNPAVESQATDRAHRIGQSRAVQVHKFVCVGTLEERIDRMLTEKLALADQIIGSGDDWLTGLSTEDLRQALMLSNEAVGEY